jgi:hypothetical protein
MGHDQMHDEWPQPSRSSWRNSVSPGKGAQSIHPRPDRPMMLSRTQLDDEGFSTRYEEPRYQDTVLLRSVAWNDIREHQEGGRRSRWLIAGVALSLALIAIGAVGCSRYATQMIPTPSSSAMVNASSTSTTESTTAGPTGTPNAIPVATSTTPPRPTATPAPQSGPFQLVFDDEFNGSSVNQSAWDLYSGTPAGNTATQ